MVREGEKSSKFFLNLEKTRQKRKVMKHLVTNSGLVLSDQETIINEQVQFYSKLYKSEPTDESATKFLLDQLSRHLSTSDSESCDNNLTSEEFCEALASMETDKSPGLDGLTVKFFRHFWPELADIFSKLVDNIFRKNELCKSMKTGVLTLIPKKGDLRKLTNWRPISLLNTDYKIIAKTIANRISKIIQCLISEDQTCCLPGRDITGNVLIMQNIIDYVNLTDSDGLVLKIDQFKAFDRVEHTYLFRVIEGMGFGQNIQKWIRILYNNIEGCIKHNGFISDTFQIERGVRQGCPLSAILYVLCAEPFHEAICKCPDISGIRMGEVEAKMFQHADDTTFFVENVSSIQSILKIIEVYERASGSKCNIDKTEMLVIGRSMVSPGDYDFHVRGDFIEILGVTMGNNKRLIEKQNWEKPIKNCLTVMSRWRNRRLSFKGKMIIVNSLVISRLVYVANVSPVPKWVADSMRRGVTDFLWGEKKRSISYTTLLMPIDKGGLNLSDIEILRDALRIKLIGKLFRENYNEKLKLSTLYFLNQYENMNLGLQVFYTSPQARSLTKLQPYYSEMLQAWKKVAEGRLLPPHSREEILLQPIFHNPHIRTENDSPLFNRNFIEGNMVEVRDLMYEMIPKRLPTQAVLESIILVNPNSSITYDEVDDFIETFMNAVPPDWLDIIYESDKVVTSQEEGDLTLRLLYDGEYLNISKLKVKQISSLLRSCDITNFPKGEIHWKNKFPTLNFVNRWKNVYKSPKVFLEADIDFKILHNILFTNDKLYDFGMHDSPLCVFCEHENETICHLFIDCTYVNMLWKQLIGKFNIIYKIDSQDDWKPITLFGLGLKQGCREGVLIDFVLNIYKRVIWSCRATKLYDDYFVNMGKFFHNSVKKRLKLLYRMYEKNQKLEKFWDLFAQQDVLISKETDGDYSYHLDRG